MTDPKLLGQFYCTLEAERVDFSRQDCSLQQSREGKAMVFPQGWSSQLLLALTHSPELLFSSHP